MGKHTSKKRRQLKLAHRAHPLSHIIRSITSKTKRRLLREHYHDVRQQLPRNRTENLLSSGGGFTFSGSGARFQQYGKLNHKVPGWNEERINRLLEPRVSNEEINLPDGPTPRLDSDYIDKHLLCLPEELRKNIRRQGVKKRQRRIESYFVNTYGYIPPRVRRLISGSYRLSDKGLPALRKTAKSDARRRYIQHLSESSLSASPSSSISTPPRHQHQPQQRRYTDNSSSPSTSHLSPLGFSLSPISPSIHDIIQQVQGTEPLQGLSSFQVVNRQYDRSRSPSVEITGDQAGQTPPPPPPPTPPGEKQYEEYDENSPPYSTRSNNFMGFSPLQEHNDDTPLPPPTTPGQVAMNLVEDSAKDLETVLNVAETGVKSLLSRIRAGEKVVATAEAPSSVPPAATTNDDDNIDTILHDILEEEFNHPPINKSIGEHRQYHMETENMYNDLLDHNNTPLLPPTPPPSRKKSPMAPRIAHKPPMPIAPVPRIAHKPPMPIAPVPRIAHKPPMPIASPPTRIAHKSPSRNTKIKHAGTQVGNDREVHNTLNGIFRDFCKGRKNTKQATHKIIDIVHQISKDNIR